MKEIFACLLFLICGIYSQTKLCIYQTSILILILILIELFAILSQKYNGMHKYKFNNCKSMLKIFLNKKELYKLLICFVFFIIGYSNSYLSNNHYNQKAIENLYVNKTYEGTIIDTIEKVEKFKTIVRLDSISEKIELYISKDIAEEIYPGYKIQIKGILKHIEQSKNLGQFDEKNYKRQRKIYYNFSGEIISIEKGKIFLITDLYKLRHKLCTIYDSFLDEKYSSIVKAMIIGENQLIDSETKELYKNAGIFHILAISGMHIGIIALYIKRLLNKIIKNKKIKFLILISLLAMYVVLTGMSISTVRAMLMMSFRELGDILGRDYNKNDGLCFAALILLIFNNANLFNISFILSFAAILSLNFNLNFKGIFKPFSSNISLFIFMAPILMYNFYTFQGLSILSNFFILPLTETLVMSSIIILFFNFINYNLAIALGKIISLILVYFEEVLTYLSKLDGFNIISGKLSIRVIAIWYISYFIIYKLLKEHKDTINEKKMLIRETFICSFCICAIIITFIHKSDDVIVTFIDVEHGDSILTFDKYNNKAMLIDGGGKNENTNDHGYYTIKPYLSYLGISKIDLCVVTHTDRDHIKGIYELIDLCEIGKVAFSKSNHEGKYYNEIIQKCKEKNIEIIYLSEGDDFSIGKISCSVLYPPKDIDKYNVTENNKSLVINMNIGKHDLLFTGDIEKEAEEMMISKLPRNVYILKLPHHGSKTSSTLDFVRQVSPKYVILSGNKTNYNNYNKENKYKYIMSKLITTYKSGMIIYKFKG